MSKMIFLVDDEKDVRAGLRILLRAQGYNTAEAENGEVALEMLQEVKPDLILLDVQMPKMDGFSFCRHLRQEIGDTSTYIAMVSAKNKIVDRVEGLSNGVDVYFTKPFNTKELVAQIKVGLVTTDQRRNSLKDSLTKLPSRIAFEEALKRELGRFKRQSNNLVLSIIDLDYFKKINDEKGHSTGDAVLVDLAQLFGRQVRESDFLARWGGDEFVLIFPDCTLEMAEIKMEGLRKSVEQHCFPEIEKERLSVSIGVTQIRKEDSFKSFFKRADRACYQAKNGGRNRVIALP
ncbi:MAG: hypothetical protein COB67_09675 [SAR324 cluster bacterium]|uniref:Diguanylate cyclase response regulator n=1 Tax=SAR324 cluster bacterium TaxID=2024889 RepID=A0A2A4T0K9_9DELT|nr:MAG: hypothetical protein COB67_09675 [SAR324 cluster bacterium]